MGIVVTKELGNVSICIHLSGICVSVHDPNSESVIKKRLTILLKILFDN